MNICSKLSNCYNQPKMDDFFIFFQMGWDHIMSWEALDHLLFIAALTALYSFKQWKQLLILITAFTLGHTLTLALSMFKVVSLNNKWIEFLIPVTILITSIFNWIQKGKLPKKMELNYLITLFFGLIHGLGFASTIKQLLIDTQTIVIPLFSFNFGIEAAQVVIVLLLLYLSKIMVDIIGLSQKYWTISISLVTFIFSIYFCIERWPY